MNIAVITFSDFNTNYGSMLQAFAMKYYLESLGHNITFIRYREFNKIEYHGVEDFCVSKVKAFILNTYRYTKRKDICRSNENFERFKTQHLNYTPLCVTEGDFANLPKFDCYICGSDQIWNINCLGGLRKPYFLNFAPEGSRKIAYAASMGDYTITPQLEAEITELLAGLDAISVREKQSIPQLQRLIPKTIYHVVDPTFLLSRAQWDTVSGPRLIEGDYAVCYLVRRSKFCKQLIQRLRKVYNIPIINISDNQIYISGTDSRFISVGPIEFVSLVKYAKFAVGTSFHLAAFSTIFGVPFLIAGMESNRDRINNLLEMAELEKSYVTPEEDISFIGEYLDNSIPNETAIQQEIEKSKSFLAMAMDLGETV